LVRGNLEVRRLPPEEEPGAPGAYGGAGSIDGTIPGKFWINLRTTDLHTKFDLPDLTHHEAIPGHVWQGEYANKLPLIRTMLAFNAYSEGWALYAQQLADEFGLYDDFPAGRLGYLQGIAFRACRLVVDTGLHAKGWSREQACASSWTRTAPRSPKPARRSTVTAAGRARPAATRSATPPSTANARGRKAALGSRYDIRTFNDAVLLGGNVPMDVLALNVGEYIVDCRSPKRTRSLPGCGSPSPGARGTLSPIFAPSASDWSRMQKPQRCCLIARFGNFGAAMSDCSRVAERVNEHQVEGTWNRTLGSADRAREERQRGNG
jgi:hypothetical protein